MNGTDCLKSSSEVKSDSQFPKLLSRSCSWSNDSNITIQWWQIHSAMMKVTMSSVGCQDNSQLIGSVILSHILNCWLKLLHTWFALVNGLLCSQREFRKCRGLLVWHSASQTTSGAPVTVIAMAFFTRLLQDLPAIMVNDVIQIIQTTSKKDKGFNLHVSSYINNYEGKWTVHQSDSDTC